MGPVPEKLEGVVEATGTMVAGFGRDGKGRLLAPMLAPSGSPIPGPNGPR
jgi:hypothetical protein